MQIKPTRIERVCARCGASFTVPHPSYRKTHCSQSCAAMMRWGDTGLISACEVCGISIRTRRSFVQKGGGRYCSNACKASAQRIGEERVCPTCGGTFYLSRGNKKRGQGTYCSVGCFPRTTGTMVPCAACGQPFYRQVSHGRQRACSDACMRILRRTRQQRACIHCGRAFTASAAAIRVGHGRYCSRTCHYANVRDESATHRCSWAYKRWRIDVFRRDGFACQSCGQTGGTLNAHHIKGFTSHPDLRFDLANGVTLCEPCHIARHQREGTLYRV